MPQNEKFKYKNKPYKSSFGNGHENKLVVFSVIRQKSNNEKLKQKTKNSLKLELGQNLNSITSLDVEMPVYI